MLENHLDVSRSVASIYGTHIAGGYNLEKKNCR